jgi:hypothetical protein
LPPPELALLAAASRPLLLPALAEAVAPPAPPVPALPLLPLPVVAPWLVCTVLPQSMAALAASAAVAASSTARRTPRGGSGAGAPVGLMGSAPQNGQRSPSRTWR